MGKDLFIAEKPSVAREFAKALKYNMSNRDGYMESNEAIVTWCVGHLVTMSYPDAYDPELKRWTLKTLPFIPEENLCLYRLRAGRRIYLPSGGKAGRCPWQGTPPGLD